MNQRHPSKFQQNIIAAIQHLAEIDAEYYSDDRQLIKVWEEGGVYLAEITADEMDSLIYEMVEADETGVTWQYIQSEKSATLAPNAVILWDIASAPNTD